VRDPLSFRRFLRPTAGGEDADHASIWRFRQAIDKLGLSTRALSRRARLRHEEALEWYGRVRYLGRARNACHLQFIAMAMNCRGRSC
jgi:hypothetical protein